MTKYSLDPGKISLEHFLELTRSRRMLPGRVMLHEKIDERFAKLRAAGINTLADLLFRLGSKEKIEHFSPQSGIDNQYLVLLKREAGSYLARPYPLSSFPGIPFEYTESLKSKGIRSSRKFFENAQTDLQRKELAGKTGIPEERLRELYVLCDLSRITGVGGTMARIVYEAGIRSTREFAENHEQLADQFAEEDIRYCVEYAKVIAEMEMDNF